MMKCCPWKDWCQEAEAASAEIERLQELLNAKAAPTKDQG